MAEEFYEHGQTSGSQNTFYLCNHLGSFETSTDSTGAPSGVYRYRPFGSKATENLSSEMDFQFAGYYYHAPSGLNLTPYRAYQSRLGRWLSRDPVYEAGGINLYCYVDNSPANSTDTLGLVRNVDLMCLANPWDRWRFRNTKASEDYFTVAIHGFPGRGGFGYTRQSPDGSNVIRTLTTPEDLANLIESQGGKKCKKCVVIYACEGGRSINGGMSLCAQVAKILKKCVICSAGSDLNTDPLGNSGSYGPGPWFQFDSNGSATPHGQ